MDLGDITLFVGGNNAGKSTIAKAIMLVTDNIKALRVAEGPKTKGLKPYFRFDTIDPQHNLHVSDFERALHRGSESKEIMLSATFNGTEISFFITSDVTNVSEQGPTAPISKIVVKNHIEDMRFTFDFWDLNRTIAEFNIDTNATSSTANNIEQIKGEIEELKQNLLTVTNPIEAASISSEIKRLESQIQNVNALSRSDYKRIEIPFPPAEKYKNDNLLVALSKNVYDYAFAPNEVKDKRSKEYKNTEADKQYLQSKAYIIEDMFVSSLNYDWNQMELYYIPAHLASQDAIYWQKDQSYLSSTIHDFYSSRINKGEEEYEFVNYWMKRFELGSDFTITPIKGEAYTVDIETENGPVPMADLGMGGIQIMTLLLRFASIMRMSKSPNFGPLIIIEEPELNLHPQWQSMLLDLFYDVYDRTYDYYNATALRMIIETHSEYLVRSSQVKVAYTPEAKGVFKVYYFPKEGLPYDMEYTDSGRFVNKFAPGFYDEAGGLNLQLIKKERGLDV